MHTAEQPSGLGKMRIISGKKEVAEEVCLGPGGDVRLSYRDLVQGLSPWSGPGEKKAPSRHCQMWIIQGKTLIALNNLLDK